MKQVYCITAVLALSACVAKEGPRVPESSRAAGALIVAYSADSADTFVANRVDSVIALDWLREVAGSHKLEFGTKAFPFGTLVEQIGHRRNGEGGYWLYQVNGQMIPKSSDAHRVAWSDTVTFFFDQR